MILRNVNKGTHKNSKDSHPTKGADFKQIMPIIIRQVYRIRKVMSKRLKLMTLNKLEKVKQFEKVVKGLSQKLNTLKIEIQEKKKSQVV